MEYLPAPDRREEIDAFNKRIADFTGLSPAGRGRLEVGWGCDIKKLYAGVEQPKYYDPNGKYYGLPYYVLEVWQPSEVYDRTEWAQLRYEGGIDVLGPFPRAGVWDLFKICRRDDLTPMPLGEEIFAIVRAWKFNATRPEARQRAIAEYKRFNEEMQARRESAFQTYRNELLGDLEAEFKKEETAPVSSFSKEVREAGVGDVPAGFTRSDSGLIIPQQ